MRAETKKLGKLSVGKRTAHVAVNQYTKEGVLIKSFMSQHEAERVAGVHNGNISECLSGKRNSAGGFIWRKK